LWTDRLQLRGDHLQLWGDRLYVSLEPESVAACRVHGFFHNKLISKDFIECDPSYGSAPWDGAVETLKKHLDSLKAERLKVTVVLSNRLVRYALVPFDTGVSGPEEEQALARFHFTRIYGDRAKGWDLRLDESAPGRPRLASALDEGLMKALRACFDFGVLKGAACNHSQSTTLLPRKRMYVRRPLGPNKTTSYRSGLPPSMPGEPIGMPGTTSPVTFGFSARKRLSAVAGTCPSMT